jgi:hypothetical protein
MPPELARLSGTRLWPICADIFCPTVRPTMSLGEPGANGRISLMGLLG